MAAKGPKQSPVPGGAARGTHFCSSYISCVDVPRDASAHSCTLLHLFAPVNDESNFHAPSRDSSLIDCTPGGYLLPSRTQPETAMAAGAGAQRRATRADHLACSPSGRDEKTSTEDAHNQEQIDTAILQLERHVTISESTAGPTAGPPHGGAGTQGAGGGGGCSLPSSVSSSLPGSLPSSLPGSHMNSGYNTPQGVGALGTDGALGGLSPPTNPYHYSTPISASAGARF
jgi:hypothetical protein